MSEPKSIGASEEKPEVWKAVVGYEGRYEVSSIGRVRGVGRVVASCYGSTRTQPALILKQRADRGGKKLPYRRVHLRGGRRDGNRFVHRIVAEAFIPNPSGLPFINHKNFDVGDNSVGNLEWTTSKENNAHTRMAGRAVVHSGSLNRTAVTVESIDASGAVTRYSSMSEACAATGLKLGALSSAIGRGYRAGGKRWRRIGRTFAASPQP